MWLMKIIGRLSRKGGSGKTTHAVHLAVLAQQGNRRTLIIDLDPAAFRGRLVASP
jgi:chromosome partitioning protein